MNVSLLRNIRIVEGVTMQLRAETYNTLNHTNWSGPNTSLNSTSFGDHFRERRSKENANRRQIHLLTGRIRNAKILTGQPENDSG